MCDVIKVASEKVSTWRKAQVPAYDEVDRRRKSRQCQTTNRAQRELLMEVTNHGSGNSGQTHRCEHHLVTQQGAVVIDTEVRHKHLPKNDR